MIGDISAPRDFSLFKKRAQELVAMIKRSNPSIKTGGVLVFANLEQAAIPFIQEPSFYYETGLHEPGGALLLYFTGEAILYVPQFTHDRSQWITESTLLGREDPASYGFNQIKSLGKACPGYQLYPTAPDGVFANLARDIEHLVSQGAPIFTMRTDGGNSSYAFGGQAVILERLKGMVSNFAASLCDVSSYVAYQRVRKDMHEIDQLYKAAEITSMAHEAAARAISDGVFEAEVQASVEYIFTASGARSAFSTVVGSGKNSTILHYTDNRDTLHSGDLVIVDCGAQFNNYCADVTRTYPVSGRFTKRQREIYELVLAAQNYIADKAQPGYWLCNADEPDKSLHHLAKSFFEKRGYGDYFVHGIGHYLGLQVHDVGDYKQPLEDGMVITIEPGVYIPEEKCGVRIEDDYWIVKNDAICLTESLPKQPDDIEELMKESADDSSQAFDQAFEENEVGES